MVELRCNNCKRVFQYSGDEKFYTACPQCNAQVPIARPRNYGTNNPEYSKVKETPHLSKAIFSDE
jgi:DNA-directed RNA polymerase subunit RPC12/RpoP